MMAYPSGYATYHRSVIRQKESIEHLIKKAHMKLNITIVLLLISIQISSQDAMKTEEQLSHCTIKLSCVKEKTNDKGDTIKYKTSGTGFFINTRIEGVLHSLLVTNKHVIKDAISASLVFTMKDAAGNPEYGKHITYNIDNFEDAFFLHPDTNIDLCAMPMTNIHRALQTAKLRVFVRNTPSSFLLSEEEWSNTSQGEEVLMVGYPKGLIDNRNNAPIMRRGITATSPKLDYKGKAQFLIDMPVFKGSSGSPVFLKKPTMKTNKVKEGTQIISSFEYKLLGIVYASPMYKVSDEETAIEIMPIEDMDKSEKRELKMPMNLGVVIKSSQLTEIINLIIKSGV